MLKTNQESTDPFGEALFPPWAVTQEEIPATAGIQGFLEAYGVEVTRIRTPNNSQADHTLLGWSENMLFKYLRQSFLLLKYFALVISITKFSKPSEK